MNANKINTENLYKLFDKYPNACLEFYNGCSELGYDDKPTILGNWNNTPPHLFDRLENAGFNCEWYDEWLWCDECYKVFRTSPNCYGWSMYGHVYDGFALCGNCLDILELCESFENVPTKAIVPSLFDKYRDLILDKYEPIEEGFENGLHEYQNDNPTKILDNLLESNPDSRYLFIIDGISQFDIGFSIYKRIE